MTNTVSRNTVSRFICPELESLTPEKALAGLYLTRETDDPETFENGVRYVKMLENDVTGSDGSDYVYIPEAIQNMRAVHAIDSNVRSISTLASDIGLTIEDNLSTAKTFRFLFQRPLDIRSSLWFTVVSEEGLHFLKPVRGSGAKLINAFEVMAESQDMQTADFTGESDGDFTIGIDVQCTVPIAADATVKTWALNKYRAQGFTVWVESPEDAAPLDFFHYAGETFVILSRQESGRGTWIYTAVRESDETYSFSGSNIYPTPNIAVNDRVIFAYSPLSESELRAGYTGEKILYWNDDEIWHAGNDGAGSGLDADLVDGKHASDFALAGHNHDDRYYTETEVDSLLDDYLPLTGGTISGNLGVNGNLNLPSFGTSRFQNGGTDGAGYSGNNVRLSCWWGMGFYNPTSGGAYPNQISGFVDFRNGRIDMKGGFRVNGDAVWHAGNLTPSDYWKNTGKTWTRIPAFLNGWAHWNDASAADFAYCVEGDLVHLYGMLDIRNSTASQICTLPTAIRPTLNMGVAATTNTGAAVAIDMLPDGTFLVKNYAAISGDNWLAINIVYDKSFNLG